MHASKKGMIKELLYVGMLMRSCPDESMNIHVLNTLQIQTPNPLYSCCIKYAQQLVQSEQ